MIESPTITESADRLNTLLPLLVPPTAIQNVIVPSARGTPLERRGEEWERDGLPLPKGETLEGQPEVVGPTWR